MATMARATDGDTQAQRFIKKSEGAWNFDDAQDAIDALAEIHDMTGVGRVYEFKDGSIVVERRGEYCTYASIDDLLATLNPGTN